MPRRTTAAPGVRDAIYVLFLGLVLGVGVLGVLLLNTSMQQQSHRLDVQRSEIGQLHDEMQQLRTALDQAADPARLALAARRLHMQPVRQVRFAAEVLSAPRQGAGRAHAG